MANLLFEIGVEEIPARFIPSTISQLEENFKRIFEEYRINFDKPKVYATPRRLTIKAKISQQQTTQEKLIWGPPAHVAFDKNGNPDAPALAFAKAQGIEVSELQIKQKGKGNYVCAVIKEKGKNTEEVLHEVLKSLFFSLTFPKMMRWGNGNLKFVRPVRWLLALYEDRVIEFEIEGIKSDCKTSGHRFLAENPLTISKIDEYENHLEKAFVIVDQEKRKETIVNQAIKCAEKISCTVLLDDRLVEEVNYLVEFPDTVLCVFSDQYISLPEELLITVMKDHQRYFAVIDSSGRLKNHFIVVSNTSLENRENVRKGAERVIRARFEDARFYYKEDLKNGIERLLEATKGIVYHKKLGSLYDKTIRIINIATKLSQKLLPEKTELIRLASKYCKADLASGVVREFPELQGIMGGYYVRAANFPDEVAQAINEHYLPKTFQDKVPSSDAGCIVSIADKLDHIASFFYLEELPTGTEDPFGLRRAANGIIAILLKKKYLISIEDVVDMIDELIDEETKKRIAIFIAQRLESYLETSGYDVNMIKTVNDFILNRPVYEIENRIQAVKLFQKNEEFESFFLAVKRVSNIIKDYEKIELNPELFITEEEKELYKVMLKNRETITIYLKHEQFLEALNHLNQLTPVINNFFDRVLVMDKNEHIKRNRIALIQELSELLKSVADISKLY